VSQQTFVITGATDGIGKQTALEVLRRGHRAVIHGRTPGKAQATAAELKAQSGSALVEACSADLASLDEVRKLAEDLSARFPVLDGLINNAGVFVHERQLTKDGFELTFGVNHLAPFLLTELLLPALKAAPQGRVVNVSSMAHMRGAIDLNNLNADRGFNGYNAYANSKLANVLFTYALARRLAQSRVTTNALHPGVITTKLLKEGFGSTGASLEQGAATSVRVALDPNLAGVTGRYFSDQREAQSSSLSHDQALQEALYTRSLSLVGRS
jgi:NAD(P)-dependent dehydrogenase (short-subunit alcohol dehydrogenase family)